MTLVLLLHVLAGAWTGVDAACAVPVLTVIAPSVDNTAVDNASGSANKILSLCMPDPRID
jgi:hypothetical protein